MSPEVELVRALSEDLALEILASYAPEDFADADFTRKGSGILGRPRLGTRARARRANHENSERGGYGYRNLRPRLRNPPSTSFFSELRPGLGLQEAEAEAEAESR